MNGRVIEDEDFDILKKLEEYKCGRSLPNEQSFKGMIGMVHKLIDKLYEYEDYKLKMEGARNSRRRREATVVVMERDGSIWKSEDTPVGMEVEAIVRLLNSSEARDRRDFYVLPVHIRATELRPPSDAVCERVAGTQMSFRKVDRLKYRG